MKDGIPDNYRKTIDTVAGNVLKQIMWDGDSKAVPDKFGCDKIFIETFLTIQMADDFVLIANDFLRHEWGQLAGYRDVEYLSMDSGFLWPEEKVRNEIMNLMMNALNRGSEYTKSLFIYLYKIYYKKEYKALKHFNKLSEQDVYALACSEDTFTTADLARVLKMAELLGIEIDDTCDVVYFLLNDQAETVAEADRRSFDEEAEQYLHDSMAQVEELFAQTNDISRKRRRFSRFSENVLRFYGYDEKYIESHETDEDWRVMLARVLALLKRTYPARALEDFSKDEILCYAEIYRAVRVINEDDLNMQYVTQGILHGEAKYEAMEKGYRPLFDPGAVCVVKKSPEPVVGNAAGDFGKAPGKHDEQEMMKEIRELQRKVHMQETEIKQAMSDNAMLRQKLAEKTERVNLLEENRSELISLRNYVYHLTEEDKAEEKTTISEMTEYLRKRAVVIVGGHAIWVSKLKKIFPGWTYISPEVSGTLDTHVVQGADYVYFFTDVISHNTYLRYIKAVRGSGTPFSYIHGVNINSNISQIYADIKMSMEEK
ncbi:MAG: hypothetical protein IJ794_06700 [Lachnospiraceae bacterium]|nr:hypothetical protein [Lachnospiraceae bacterium]